MKIHLSRSNQILATLAICIIATYTWATTWVVCPNCGRDIDMKIAKCTCGVVIPRAQVDTPQKPRLKSELERSFNEDCPELEQKLKQAYPTAEPFLCALYLRNLIAIYAMIEDEKQVAHYYKLLEELQPKLNTAMLSCPNCKGKGKVVRTISFMNSSSLINCPVCQGRASIMRKYTAQESGIRHRSARINFVKKLEQWRCKPVGGGFLPSHFTLNDDLRFYKIRFATHFPAACNKCMGGGYLPCSKCNFGRTECKVRDCEDGIIPPDRKQMVRRTLQDETVKCSECHGKAWLSCKSCTGLGKTFCPDCKGKGTLLACKECNGTGLDSCRECQGKGKVKERVKGEMVEITCPDCKGAKRMACRKCNGDGHNK